MSPNSWKATLSGRVLYSEDGLHGVCEDEAFARVFTSAHLYKDEILPSLAYYSDRERMVVEQTSAMLGYTVVRRPIRRPVPEGALA